MRLTTGFRAGLLAGLLLASPRRAAPLDAGGDLAAADALRRGGDPEAALPRYRAALAAGAPAAVAHHRLGQCLEALGRPAEAEREYAAAAAAAPSDGEIREDLDGLRARHGLTLRADLGGTEPGTSRQAFEAVARYGGLDRLELQGGYSYSDQVYYRSNRGFLTAYRFHDAAGSYGKLDLTLRRYDYPVNPSVRRPTPDSNAYDWVPRGELELSQAVGSAVRLGVAYQLFPANFFYDTGSWTVNQKLSGQVELRPVPALRLRATAAALRDPDPHRTEIAGRPSPLGGIAPATHVVYRTTSLVGGGATLALDRVALDVLYLPNRDLDNGYAWSILTTLDLRVAAWLDVRLQEVHDRYASVSNYPGRTAEIYMGAAVWKVSRALSLRAGLRWVDAPTRTGGTGIAGVEWRTGIL